MRDAETFTVDDPRFSTGRVVGPSMLSRDGAEHDRHRAPFARPFRLDAVRARFTARVAAEVEALLDGLEPARRGRPARRARRAAGRRGRRRRARPRRRPGRRGPRLVRGDRRRGHCGDRRRAAARRRAAGYAALRAAIEPELDRDPLSSLSPRPRRAGALSRDEVASNAAVLLFGGIETTEGMIATALLHLLVRPARARARVRADPALLVSAVEESLRLEPAAATVDRYATRDVEFGGAQIRAGDLVIVSIAAANRDPQRSTTPTASASTARTPGATSRSPPARTSASGCTSRASRPTPPSPAPSTASRTSPRPRRPPPRRPRPRLPQAPSAPHPLGSDLASAHSTPRQMSGC